MWLQVLWKGRGIWGFKSRDTINLCFEPKLAQVLICHALWQKPWQLDHQFLCSHRCLCKTHWSSQDPLPSTSCHNFLCWGCWLCHYCQDRPWQEGHDPHPVQKLEALILVGCQGTPEVSSHQSEAGHTHSKSFLCSWRCPLRGNSWSRFKLLGPLERRTHTKF